MKTELTTKQAVWAYALILFMAFTAYFFTFLLYAYFMSVFIFAVVLTLIERE
jgi:hypothetical protein